MLIDKFRAFMENEVLPDPNAYHEAMKPRFAREHEEVGGWCPYGSMGVLNYGLTHCLEPSENEHYLEIGSYVGRSLCGALQGNVALAHVIDPFEFFLPDGLKIRESWERNIKAFGVMDRVTLHKILCQNFADELPPIGFYFYDGDHDSGHTYEGLKKFMPFLADRAIIGVDDYKIYGGHQQNPFPGHAYDINYPVESDCDRWAKENSDTVTRIGYTPWLNGQVWYEYRRQ